MLSNTSSPLAARIGGRLLATALVALSLIGGLLVLEAPPLASAEDPECDVTDLGTLGGETQRLEATGRWTTEDCESAFRAGSDAHSYSFEVTETGRVRIDLLSSEADSYLYLLSGAGDRIADNDDGAAGVNARIERDLEPGAYRIEATTVGGRGRGPADFSLNVGYVEGCEPIDLGVLTAEADLTATGVWTVETCGSRIEATHPAYNYSFVLPAGGRVRIELTSEDGDPVLSLASPAGVIGANDDGAVGRNSRIEGYLPGGVYLIEATTYLQGDRQPLVADFELTVHLVDEVAAQNGFILKVEESLAPDVVIAGEPFVVDYRVGNVGGGDLPEDWFVIVYAIGPRAYADLEVEASETVWNAGASYHSSPELASATSTAIAPIEPIEVVLPRTGDSYVFLGAQLFQLVEDEGRYDNPGEFHGLWRNLRVLSGPIYGPVTVSVDGAEYTVEAADDEDGEVTTTVVSVADAEAEIEAFAEAKATYTAAVAETVLGGIFERPGLEGLWAADEALAVDIKNASSSTLLDIFAEEYERLIAESDLGEPPARREAIDPVEVEDFVLMVGNKAARQYASLAASWSALQEQIAGGEALSFEEAFALQAELAYAERILAPVATGANIVRAAREAEAGWADRRVVRMARGLAFEGACGADADERLDRFSALDAEIRAALPVFGYGVDAALCGALFVDGANSRFLARLAIESPGLTALNAPEVPEVEPVEPPPPPPYELRIIARLTEDGRVEHGVEFGSGFQILPTQRFLGTDARTGIWHITSEVELGGSSIGLVRARRLADGRIQLGFRDANGFNITPAIRFLPADLPVGSWLRSSVIEVPRPAAAE
ncbi:MAG: hypothetical protein F4Z77_04640 [Dehalococcoidia bacterium]|nr:hypothetical protein [Dehalococcoidia bacterium]MYA51864.1 hypothetical protein [Dehalococcoidia bacterium]